MSNLLRGTLVFEYDVRGVHNNQRTKIVRRARKALLKLGLAEQVVLLERSNRTTDFSSK